MGCANILSGKHLKVTSKWLGEHQVEATRVLNVNQNTYDVRIPYTLATLRSSWVISFKAGGLAEEEEEEEREDEEEGEGPAVRLPRAAVEEAAKWLFQMKKFIFSTPPILNCSAKYNEIQ